MLAGATVLGIIFIILLIVSPYIFKAIFKIETFLGLTTGLCCAFITALIIILAAIITMVVRTLNIADSATNGSQEDLLKSVGFGVLLLVFVILVAVLFAVFFVMLCYTKRVADPQNPYNTIFMFISGYMFGFIAIYLFIVIAALAVDTDNNTANTFTNGFFILWEFLIFFYILKLAGLSILLMLHHRKVNPIIFWCAIAVHFGPTLFFFIGIVAKYLPLLEYPLFLFDVASIGLGSFFYYRYANSNEGNTASQSAYMAA
jgi:hypothetical protein